FFHFCFSRSFITSRSFSSSRFKSLNTSYKSLIISASFLLACFWKVSADLLLPSGDPVIKVFPFDPDFPDYFIWLHFLYEKLAEEKTVLFFQAGQESIGFIGKLFHKLGKLPALLSRLLDFLQSCCLLTFQIFPLIGKSLISGHSSQPLLKTAFFRIIGTAVLPDCQKHIIDTFFLIICQPPQMPFHNGLYQSAVHVYHILQSFLIFSG